MNKATMWQFISEQISSCTGHLFICQHHQQIAGGDSHRCAIISDRKRRYFVKYRGLFAADCCELNAEADGLKALAAAQTIKTPEVICYGVIEADQQRYEYLVLQHLSLCQSSQADWHHCGEQLAQLHRHPVDKQFGWPLNNFIGRTPQINTPNRNWAAFFAENRIGAMLKSLSAQGHTWCNIDICITKVYQCLRPHTPTPSLVHGDLWSGNVAFCEQHPVVFDPAVYRGDRETDIAMTELFGRLPDAFYRGYNHGWPLDAGYAQRRPLYQLYHILNHALLFGGHYLQVAKQQIEQFNQQY